MPIDARIQFADLRLVVMERDSMKYKPAVQASDAAAKCHSLALRACIRRIFIQGQFVPRPLVNFSSNQSPSRGKACPIETSNLR